MQETSKCQHKSFRRRKYGSLETSTEGARITLGVTVHIGILAKGTLLPPGPIRLLLKASGPLILQLKK